MNLNNTDLILIGASVLGAVVFAVVAYTRAQKRKKEREASAKAYEAEQSAPREPLTPEEIQEAIDTLVKK